MVEREGTEGQLGHILREGEGVFNIIVLVYNRWSRLGSTEGRDRSNFDCGDSLLIFVFATIGGLNWGTDIDDCRRLLGDTGAGDETINDSFNLCPSCLTKVHLDIPVHSIKIIVSVGYLCDMVYWTIFRKVEVCIGPFLAGLGWGRDSDHVGKVIGVLKRENESSGLR